MEKPDMYTKSGVEEGSEEVDEFEKLIQALPKVKNWNNTYLCKYQNFWCPSMVLKAVVSSQKHFEPLDSDIILVSPPKSGTTWLKALVFSICNRHIHNVNDSPLRSRGPHELVPFLEFDLYLKNESPDITNTASSRRVLATHMPYDSLPASIRTSKCKIIYICRNPLDSFTSYWHFMNNLREENSEVLPLEEVLEMFCQGIHGFGPFWDHVLGYWKASLQTPDKVLFLKYEEMKKDPIIYTKMIAQFIGLPFNDMEEKDGMIDEIVRLCSFENMKNLEANNKGKHVIGAPNNAFFRKGGVGDWANLLKPNEVQRLNKIAREKLSNSGLSFDMDLQLLQKETKACE